MPERLERIARALSLCLNTVFFLLSLFLIVLVCLAAINAPKPEISPQPLNSYPQHILAQVAMIMAQLIAVAFTITVRNRLHLKLEESWRDRPGCMLGAECVPVKRFLQSETRMIIFLCVFLVLQIVQLIASSIVCEYRSHAERKEQLRQHEEEEDEY
ncbi:hypothetical protein OESDEN_08155 [Oesophagostomum dentatum]|uniref:Uncharacterized protein n=1 Tax=Oesophagostomum dentatum TaxID=61180 RepID=A0A0B1T403_OESDE|nr:hypothetical protein OESDEN_08155 [Oesophagostomum dentatum]